MNDLIFAMIASFVVSLVAGFIIIPILRKAKAGQQVRDDQTGISLISTDVHRHVVAVLHGHHAVELQRDGDPLVLADAAVVMGLEIGQLALLIEGVGL